MGVFGVLVGASAAVAGVVAHAVVPATGLVSPQSVTAVRLHEVEPGAVQPARTMVVNITGANTAAPGFVQAYTKPADKLGWSNLNFDRPGQTRPNLAFVTTSEEGEASFYSHEAVSLIVDVQGDITEGVDDLPDARLVDTRGSSGGLVPSAGAFVPFGCQAGSTVVGTLTAVDTTGDGFLQLVGSPDGPDVGGSSHLNYTAGQTIARLAVATCGNGGEGFVYSPFGNTHVLFDVQAQFKPGVFTSNPSPRSLDTREQGNPVAGGQTVTLHGQAGRTAVIGLVGTANTQPGFLQVAGEGVQLGTTSNVNLDRANTTSGSLVIAQFNQNGELPIYASHGQTDVVADIYGYLADGAFIDTPDERVLDTRGDGSGEPPSTPGPGQEGLTVISQSGPNPIQPEQVDVDCDYNIFEFALSDGSRATSYERSYEYVVSGLNPNIGSLNGDRVYTTIGNYPTVADPYLGIAFEGGGEKWADEQGKIGATGSINEFPEAAHRLRAELELSRVTPDGQTSVSRFAIQEECEFVGTIVL